MSVSIEVVDNYVYRTDKRLGEGAFGKVIKIIFILRSSWEKK